MKVFMFKVKGSLDEYLMGPDNDSTLVVLTRKDAEKICEIRSDVEIEETVLNLEQSEIVN